MLIKKSVYNGSIVFLIILMLACFYRINFFEILSAWQRFYYLTTVFFLCGIYFLKNKGQKLYFQKHLFVLMFFTVINIITCYLYREQSVINSLYGWSNLLNIFLYFGFSVFRLTIKDLERVIRWLFLVVLILYIAQYIAYPKLFLTLNIPEERLEIDLRIRIFSDGILFLGAFLYLNKFFSEKKYHYLVYFFSFLLVIFLQGFRVLIVASILSSLILVIKFYGIKAKILYAAFVGVFAIGLFSQTDMFQDRMEKIIDRSESQTLKNSDYVRVVSINYFYNQHFVDNLEMILGSGRFPGTGHSEYAKYMIGLRESRHFYSEDWGLIGLSWETGVPFVLCLILLIVRIIFLKVEKQYYYLSVWAIFLLFSSVTHYIIFYHCNLVYMAIALLIVERAHLQYQQNMLQTDNS